MKPRELAAEAIGSFALVLSLLAAQLLTPPPFSPLAGALAAGLMTVAMMAALSPVSGAHLNPAVTLGMIAAGRLDSAKAPAYIAAQCIGALSAAGLLVLAIAPRSLAGVVNGYGRTHSIVAVIIGELTSTAILVLVVLAMGTRRANAAFAPLAVGSATVALYLIAIPLSGGGLNPARSLATAAFAGVDALLQLWVFWVAPILGAVAAGVIGRALLDDQ
jgi:aquaporin Z